MSEQGDPEEYYQKLEEFAQEQQNKVKDMIEQSHKMMEQLKPFDMAENVDEKVDKLVKSVNDELEKAMGQVNDQMKQLNEKMKS